MKDEEVLQDAIDTFGRENQLMILIEELAELQTALIHFKRGRCDSLAVAEELADALICIDQAMLIFKCESLVDDIRFYKIARLRRRIDAAQNGGKDNG